MDASLPAAGVGAEGGDFSLNVEPLGMLRYPHFVDPAKAGAQTYVFTGVRHLPQ